MVQIRKLGMKIVVLALIIIIFPNATVNGGVHVSAYVRTGICPPGIGNLRSTCTSPLPTSARYIPANHSTKNI